MKFQALVQVVRDPPCYLFMAALQTAQGFLAPSLAFTFETQRCNFSGLLSICVNGSIFSIRSKSLDRSGIPTVRV